VSKVVSLKAKHESLHKNSKKQVT